MAQVLGPEGDVAGGADGRPLLSADETRRALRGTITLERDRVEGLEGAGRVLATPVDTGEGRSRSLWRRMRVLVVEDEVKMAA